MYSFIPFTEFELEHPVLDCWSRMFGPVPFPGSTTLCGVTPPTTPVGLPVGIYGTSTYGSCVYS